MKKKTKLDGVSMQGITTGVEEQGGGSRGLSGVAFSTKKSASDWVRHYQGYT